MNAWWTTDLNGLLAKAGDRVHGNGVALQCFDARGADVCRSLVVALAAVVVEAGIDLCRSAYSIFDQLSAQHVGLLRSENRLMDTCPRRSA